MTEITPDLWHRVLDGDEAAQDEARALMSAQQTYFARWATHRTLGRVLCVNHFPDEDGTVCVLTPKDIDIDGSALRKWVDVDSLIFDPVELVTEQDFRDAPEGTIVELDFGEGGVAVKDPVEGWRDYRGFLDSSEMESVGPWRIVRWGSGGRV